MIEVKNLSKRYGSRLAIDAISFKVPQGEIVGLLGPNGAGKTTTMRILTGFMPATSGTVHIAGLDIQEDSTEARAKVGYLPERVPVYPDMTVEAYLRFWAKLRGVRRPAPQVNAVLERVKLHDRRSALIRSLSKGMLQRLGLAQALVHSPPVIILDEPTIGIDPKQVVEVRDLVRSLAHDHTVLLSTHILSEAEQLCDRVVIIHQGKLITQGHPSELGKRLQSGSYLYVAISGIDADKIEKLLKNLAGVESVERAGDGHNIRVRKGSDVRAELIDRVVKGGGMIEELRPIVANLESIFLEAVGKGKRN